MKSAPGLFNICFSGTSIAAGDGCQHILFFEKNEPLQHNGCYPVILIDTRARMPYQPSKR
jgi:hypothetical protein